MKLKRKIKKNILKNGFEDLSSNPLQFIEDFKDLMNLQIENDSNNLNNLSDKNQLKGLEKMSEEDFEFLKEYSPYYYFDDDGNIHFTSKFY